MSVTPFGPKFSELFVFTHRQTGFNHQNRKIILWLASCIKEQSVSRKPERFKIKDNADTKETFFLSA